MVKRQNPLKKASGKEDNANHNAKYVHIPEISWSLLGLPIGGVDFT